MSDQLEVLAGRVEMFNPSGRYDLDRARERELNEAIAAAIGMKLTVKLGDPALGNDRVVPNRLPAFVTSLDAAMTLVGPDWFWRVGNDGEGPDPSVFKAQIGYVHEGPVPISFTSALAETPALALCAAALRARAASPSEGGASE